MPLTHSLLNERMGSFLSWSTRSHLKAYLLDLIAISRKFNTDNLHDSDYATDDCSLCGKSLFVALPRVTPKLRRLYRNLNCQFGKLIKAAKMSSVLGLPSELTSSVIQQIALFLDNALFLPFKEVFMRRIRPILVVMTFYFLLLEQTVIFSYFCQKVMISNMTFWTLKKSCWQYDLFFGFFDIKFSKSKK